MLHTGARNCKTILIAECSETAGRLRYRRKLYIPASDDLHLHLLRQAPDAPAAGHSGCFKTLELIAREYFWPGMRKDVERNVWNCHPYRRSKASSQSPFGILKPNPVPDAPWQDLSMDFVVWLPESKGYDAIWVVVDRLTKLHHMVPCKSTYSSEDLADLFLHNIWKHHGLPSTVISDRGPQFASHFWKALCEHLGIERRLSTGFHRQTDGQMERFNATMEEYLRLYVNHHQDDWTDWLPLCEFAINNATSVTTQVSPFYATFGRNPRMNFNLDQPIENPEQARTHEAAANLRKIHDLIRAEMTAAQFRYSVAYDKAHRPAPKFEPGDQVWLDARHIKTTWPARKLDWKKLGPFPVKRALGSHAYELEFPADIKVHPVQPIPLLSPVAEDLLPGQIVPPPPPVKVEGEEPEYHVEAVEDSPKFHENLQYRVRWVGWPSLTWKTWYFVNTTDAVTQFHKRYPKKPGPMPQGSEVPELQRRGLSISGFAGAQ